MKIKTLRIFLSILFILGTAVYAFPESLGSPEWKVGTITDVNRNSIEIDGKLFIVSALVEIKTVRGEKLGSGLELLTGVESIFFKEKDDKIVEIRIFKSAQ